MTWGSQLLLSPGTAPGLSPEKPSTLTAACTSSVDRPRSPANLAAIAIYQSPGANAVATLQAVRARVAELEKRFPEDLAWKVTYDRTTFVTAAIEGVEKTLMQTFVLFCLVS